MTNEIAADPIMELGPTRPLRIAFVSHSSMLLGAELVLAELVRGLVSRADCDVHVLVPGSGPLNHHLGGATVHVIPWVPWWTFAHTIPRRLGPVLGYLRGHIVSVARVLIWLRRVKPDVVISNTNVICAGALAARLARRPHVWFMHEFGTRDYGFRFDLGEALTYRLIWRLSARVLVGSEALAGALEPFAGHKRYAVVPYAIEVPDECDAFPLPGSGPSGTARRFVIVGNLLASKGQADAIDALGQVHAEFPDACLRVVGPGSREDISALVTRAQVLGIQDRVDVLGHVVNPFDHFEWADVALMCSRNEAFGRVTVEAMKCGRPVIGTATGGTLELIQDGATGLLYTPGDTSELAAQMSRLCEQPGLVGILGDAARKWARTNFTTNGFLQAFLTAVKPCVKAEMRASP